MKFILALLLTYIVTFPLNAQGPQNSQEVLVELSVDLFEYQKKNYLSLSYKNAPDWHTYWKNPGEAGLATKFEFKVDDKKVDLFELEWPKPKRYVEEGNIITFGYSNEYTMFFEISDSQLKSFNNKELQVYSNWLVCKDICIPGEVTHNFRVNKKNLVPETPRPFDMITDILIARLNLLPKVIATPPYVDMVLAKDPEREGFILYTNLTLNSPSELPQKMNLLTPFQLSPFDFRGEEIYKDQNNNYYARMRIDWDGIYQSPAMPFPADGKFEKPYKFRFLFSDPREQTVQIIEKDFTDFSLNAAAGIEDFTKLLTKIYPVEKAQEIVLAETPPELLDQTGSAPLSLLNFLLFAMLGGFILNLMPCVLPVISLKLFGLIQHSKESRSRILKHNLFYTFGVLTTFWVIAAIVVFLKAAGEGVGWGFQLQSPGFVAFMTVAIFILSLNMFGLYEFATPGGRKLGGVKLENSYLGDFLSGVLATILSTPCSAPFLGTALTFAFTSSNFMVFSILTFVGIGLSLPFILTGLFPSLVKFLPRPGLWMENFKKILALTLVITSLWLLDVYGALVTDAKSAFRLQVILLFSFFIIYMWNKMTKRLLFILPFTALTIFLFFGLLTQHQSFPVESQVTNPVRQHLSKGGLEWETWSEENLREKAENKELVFINFTAQWCLTCKVHERLVIRTDSFNELVEKYDAKLMLADWTRRDQMIGEWLAARGLVGVPAYFVQLPSGELVSLGETITINKIEKVFQRAQP